MPADGWVRGPALERVVAGAATKRIAVGTAEQAIVAGAPVQDVLATVPGGGVAAPAAADPVRAGVTNDWVVTRRAEDDIRPVGAVRPRRQVEVDGDDSAQTGGLRRAPEESLDDVYGATDPASIARMCTDYGHRITLIDPGDPDHFGPDEPVPVKGPAGGMSALNPALQAAALESSPTPWPPQKAPAARGDHSPGTPGR